MQNIPAAIAASLAPWAPRPQAEALPAPQLWVIRWSAIVQVDGAPTFEVGTAFVEAVHQPDPFEHLPDDCELPRGEVFQAARFDTFAVEQRQHYKGAYRDYLMHRAARKAGLQREQMQPWVHYDAIAIDEAVQAWACGGGVRFSGG